MALRPAVVRIAKSFCGPADSGNGGYCAGVLGRVLSEHFKLPRSQPKSFSVTLKRPIPLDSPLDVVIDNDGKATMQDSNGPIMTAVVRSSHNDDVKVPADLDIEQIREIGHRTRAPSGFPTCFVCGSDNAKGLHLLPVPVDGKEMSVTTWHPSHHLQDCHNGKIPSYHPDMNEATFFGDATKANDGLIAEEFLWSALDCPSFFGIQDPQPYPALLAQYELTINNPDIVRAGDEVVVYGWELKRDGRKFWAASALYKVNKDDGNAVGMEIVGTTKALWIGPRPKANL